MHPDGPPLCDPGHGCPADFRREDGRLVPVFPDLLQVTDANWEALEWVRSLRWYVES